MTMKSNSQSPLGKLMTKGQQKVGYKRNKANLLMSLSEDDHQRIAQLIKKWLDTPNPQ